MINLVFVNNRAMATGGALDCEVGSARVIGCTFIGNTAGSWGGGLCTSGAAVVRDCVFQSNATADLVKGFGGGLALISGASVSNCVFLENQSGLGGGLAVGKYATATLCNCTFRANKATQGAGVGLYYAASVTLINSLITHSALGEAMAGNGVKTLLHCDLFGNAGGDWVGDIADQFGLNGNLSVDPLFLDGPAGDCHLRGDSPCRNAGDNEAPGLPDEDFEQDPRIAQGTVDLGADEFSEHLYVTGDAAPGGAIAVVLVGPPGTVPLGLLLGSGALENPVATPYGAFYLTYPWILIGPLGPMPAEGFLKLPGVLPASPPGPYDVPLQALIGLGAGSLTNLSMLCVR